MRVSRGVRGRQGGERGSVGLSVHASTTHTAASQRLDAHLTQALEGA